MDLVINGQPRTFADLAPGATLADLLTSLALKEDRVAVERNGAIVSRPQWPATSLTDGDKLEIVHFVGGGSQEKTPLPQPAPARTASPQKVRWGVLSTANIGVKKVIPSMQRGQLSTVTAIASRDLSKARAAAAQLGIPTAYGSYEELLADPAIDAIYNPLPNQLHVPWTAKAAEAGKHVLCEKPLSMTLAEARTLLVVRQRTGVLIGEAFMIRSHPQWLRLRALLDEGRIGDLRAVSVFFSYFNVDPANIRNREETGGGALYDIGCYCIQAARVAFRQEPTRVCALIDRDPNLRTDRLTSALLDFPAGHAIFTCSTQLVPYQRVHFFGTRGRIEIEIPFNAPLDRPTRLFLDDGRDVFGSGISTETFPVADQYTLQGDDFSRAVLEGTPLRVPLEEGIANMAVMDALFASARSGTWAPVQS